MAAPAGRGGAGPAAPRPGLPAPPKVARHAGAIAE